VAHVLLLRCLQGQARAVEKQYTWSSATSINLPRVPESPTIADPWLLGMDPWSSTSTPAVVAAKVECEALSAMEPSSSHAVFAAIKSASKPSVSVFTVLLKEIQMLQTVVHEHKLQTSDNARRITHLETVDKIRWLDYDFTPLQLALEKHADENHTRLEFFAIEINNIKDIVGDLLGPSASVPTPVVTPPDQLHETLLADKNTLQLECDAWRLWYFHQCGHNVLDFFSSAVPEIKDVSDPKKSLL
jgi:hypothetical protein